MRTQTCAAQRAARSWIAPVPGEFQPPDDGLGLAGVNSALPPIRLLHVGWRWYDPALGRFVQRDPVGLAGGLNVYVYLRANPVCVVDPLGLLPGEQWVVDWLSRHPRLAEGFINITGGRSSWLDDPKKVDQAVTAVGVGTIVVCVGGLAGAAAAGGLAAGGMAAVGSDVVSIEVLMVYRLANGVICYVVRLWFRNGSYIVKHLELRP